jgi:hypothetical protein
MEWAKMEIVYSPEFQRHFDQIEYHNAYKKDQKIWENSLLIWKFNAIANNVSEPVPYAPRDNVNKFFLKRQQRINKYGY